MPNGREAAIEAEAHRIEALMFDKGRFALTDDDRWLLDHSQGRRIEHKMDALAQAVQSLQACFERSGSPRALARRWWESLTPRNVIVILGLLTIILRGPEFLSIILDIIKSLTVR